MFDNLLSWIATSPLVKLAMILIIILLLLIPTSQIQSLIGEREYLRQQVIDEISEKWGRSQVFAGPVLTIPYTYVEGKGTKNEELANGLLHILPESLKIDANMEPEEKKRGIYKAILYSADISYSGKFDLNDVQKMVRSDAVLSPSEAFISIGVSDLKGISDKVQLYINGGACMVQPGTQKGIELARGFSAPINPDDLKELTFSGSLRLNGHALLHFTPLGRITEVNVRAPWADPSFDGAFLPSEKNVDANGFQASWKVLNFNRSYPQAWDNRWFELAESAFGVSLIEEADLYQKSTRSVKYAFIFIALTFAYFFFFEILRKMRIHPIQYTIVGISICVFYTLLIALSEHMAFGVAYLAAAFSITAITGYYFFHISKSAKASALFTSLFAALYGYIYVLLHLSQYSLLLGSLGLFVSLALVMYFTRKVDWYTLGKKSSNDTGRI